MDFLRLLENAAIAPVHSLVATTLANITAILHLDSVALAALDLIAVQVEVLVLNLDAFGGDGGGALAASLDFVVGLFSQFLGRGRYVDGLGGYVELCGPFEGWGIGSGGQVLTAVVE